MGLTFQSSLVLWSSRNRNILTFGVPLGPPGAVICRVCGSCHQFLADSPNHPEYGPNAWAPRLLLSATLIGRQFPRLSHGGGSRVVALSAAERERAARARQ
jgi:hypothetical protein